jgi:hypothetical protein
VYGADQLSRGAVQASARSLLFRLFALGGGDGSELLLVQKDAELENVDGVEFLPLLERILPLHSLRPRPCLFQLCPPFAFGCHDVLFGCHNVVSLCLIARDRAAAEGFGDGAQGAAGRSSGAA